MRPTRPSTFRWSPERFRRTVPRRYLMRPQDLSSAIEGGWISQEAIDRVLTQITPVLLPGPNTSTEHTLLFHSKFSLSSTIGIRASNFRSTSPWNSGMIHLPLNADSSAPDPNYCADYALEPSSGIRPCPCRVCKSYHPDTRRSAIYIAGKPAVRAQSKPLEHKLHSLKTTKPNDSWEVTHALRGALKVFFSGNSQPPAEIYSYDYPLAKKHQDPNADVRPMQYQNSDITKQGAYGVSKITSHSISSPADAYHKARQLGGIWDSLVQLDKMPYHRGSVLSSETAELKFEHTALREMGNTRVAPISAILDPKELATRMERYSNSASHINMSHDEFVLQSTTLLAGLEATRFLNRKIVTSGHERGFQEAPPTN